MIKTIKGQITHQLKEGVVVETGGLGYLVSVPARTWPNIGEQVFYFTYHLVRETEQALYGFTSAEELGIFNTLLSVNSVGPKLALSILSNASPDEIRSAVEGENVSFFASLPGIGKKSAAKIIVELKDKITGMALSSIPNQSTELFDALSALGFSREEISTTVKNVPQDLSDINAQVKWALGALSK